MVDHPGKGYICEVLLEDEGSGLVQVVWENALLDSCPGRGRQPLQELDDVQAVEGHAKRRRVPGHLDENMDEDYLAQNKEVVKSRTHCEYKRSHSYKKGQNSTPPEEIV